MLTSALKLRYLLLVPVLAMMIGSVMTMILGLIKFGEAAQLLATQQDSKIVIATLLSGTDTFLLSLVLLVFAASIAFGFIFDLGTAQREHLPGWLKIENIGELKSTMMSVLIIYLCVDFATDWLSQELTDGVNFLQKPIAILLLALSTWITLGDKHSSKV